MYHVRYYDKKLHPDTFRGAGVFGLLIRALNWFRWKLETSIQALVLRFFANVGSVPEYRKTSLLREFSLDVKAEELEFLATSPLRSQPSANEPTDEPPSPRGARYAEPSYVESLRSEASSGVAPMRPVPLDDLVSKYAFNFRAKRFAHGRRFSVGERDGDFEPLDQEEGERDGH